MEFGSVEDSMTVYELNRRIPIDSSKELLCSARMYPSMTERSGRTPIASHTEYARSRVRCFDCGEYVSARKARGGKIRCANCLKAEATA